MRPQKTQRGVALLTAMLIVALATMASVSVLSSAYSSIHRTRVMLDTERARWYAYGLEDWARSILQRDREAGDTDHLEEVWATETPPLPVEGGAVRGQIIDLQSRFNLNNLVSSDADVSARMHAQLERLLHCVQDDASVPVEELANAIHDWLDPDHEQRFPGGAEDLVYQSLQPLPYRAANRTLRHPSELRAVHGMTAELYAALRPHVAALPHPPTPINLNTATEPVLCSISPDPQQQQALLDLAESREDQPMDSVQALFDDGRLGTPLEPADYSVASRFFLAVAEAQIGSARAVLYSLIARPDQGAPIVLGHSTDIP